MICPNCRKIETQVIDSRDDGKTVWRRRKCLKCSNRFTTYERMEVPRLVVIKKDKTREPFNKEKIIAGMQKACEKRPIPTTVVAKAADEIEKELYEKGELEVSSKKIGEKVMERLEKIDQVAYIRFASIYRAFRSVKSFDKAVQKIMHK